MLPAMDERIAARGRPVARLVVIGLGYNSLWERAAATTPRGRASSDGSKELLATLRRKGARRSSG